MRAWFSRTSVDARINRHCRLFRQSWRDGPLVRTKQRPGGRRLGYDWYGLRSALVYMFVRCLLVSLLPRLASFNGREARLAFRSWRFGGVSGWLCFLAGDPRRRHNALCLTRIFGRTVPLPLSTRGHCCSQTKACLGRSQVDITPQRIPSSRSIVLDNKVRGHLIVLAQGGCAEVAERRRSAETTEGTVILVSSGCNYKSPPLPFLRCIVILIPSILQPTRIRPC